MRLKHIPEHYTELGIEMTDPSLATGRRFADFMLVGPQRTGTTKLWRAFRAHPAVCMTVPKEPSYFSNLVSPRRDKYVSKDFLSYIELFSLSGPNVKRLLRKSLKFRQVPRRLLFGEASASYAAGLTPDMIAFIASLNPDLRIVIGIRDPVQRAWSHAKKDLSRNIGRPLAEIPLDEFKRFFDEPYVAACGRYDLIIERWLSFFPREQVFLLEYSEFQKQTEEILNALCNFLGLGIGGVRWHRKVSEDGIVNATEAAEIPDALIAHLEDQFATTIDLLQRKFRITLR